MRGKYHKKKGWFNKNKRNFKDFEYNDERFFSLVQSNDEKKKEEQVIKSTEKGFTGTPDTWYSNEEFFKGLCGHSDIEGKKDYYFNSYSSFNIHEEMLKDRIRTNTYKEAIMNNPDVFKDKIVLDIGCGTGILSIFAAKAGAKHVYGIEFADIADYAIEIIKNNNLTDKITIIKSKVEEAELPVPKVDIIISEWMGYFLLFESMLDTVLYARDKWLNQNGYILPDRASITIAAIEDVDYKASKMEFWDNVYGINMSCFKPTILADPLIDQCPQEAINSSTCTVFDIDLYKVKKEELDFTSKYELTFMRNDSFSGIVAWFDVGFTKLMNKMNLSTSPFLKTTHWKQTTFYTEKDIKVKKGDIVSGSIAVRKAIVDFRHIDVKISYHIQNDRNNQNWYQLYKIE